MGDYKLREIDATVGMFGDFTNFKDVIDWLLAAKGFKRGLEMLGLDDVEDLSEALVDDQGCFDEDRAMQLCMDNLDGVSGDYDENKEFELACADHKADEMAGR